MSQLIISDLEFFKDISNQLYIHGGSRRSSRGVDVALDAEFDADFDVDFTTYVGPHGTRRVSAFARAVRGSALASATAVGGGRARASASVQL
ncbi:hypothetical protein Lepto7375DRAFT_8151 [Leptolyngbya sp. PCC 7375]|nr:hypothetical protein Lepto7375DRAFT_8151 [Leptolyngbya sp. PCC 7375]